MEGKQNPLPLPNHADRVLLSPYTTSQTSKRPSRINSLDLRFAVSSPYLPWLTPVYGVVLVARRGLLQGDVAVGDAFVGGDCEIVRTALLLVRRKIVVGWKGGRANNADEQSRAENRREGILTLSSAHT